MKLFNEKQVEKLWTKNYIFILFLSFLLMTAYNMVTTVLPLYARDIGANNSIAGVMIGILTFSALLTRPLFGNLLTIYGNKRILMIGISIISIAAIAQFFVHTIIFLVALRVVTGIGFSAFTTAAGTIVSNIVPEKRRGEGIGYYGLSFVITTAFGPSLGLYLIQNQSYSFVFAIGAIICIIGLTMSSLIRTKEMAINRVAGLKRKRMVLFERTAIPAALVLFSFAFGHGGLVTFIPIYAGIRHINNISLFFPVYAVSILLSRIGTGKLFDRSGISPFIIPSIILTMSGLMILAYANTISAFLLAGALFGFGYGSIQPSLFAVMITVCPPERRSLANAAFYSTMDVSIGLGAFVCGILSQWVGFTTTYTITSSLILFSFLAYTGLLKKQMLHIQQYKENKERIEQLKVDLVTE